MGFWKKERDYDYMGSTSYEQDRDIADAVKDTRDYHDDYTGETIER